MNVMYNVLKPKEICLYNLFQVVSQGKVDD